MTELSDWPKRWLRQLVRVYPCIQHCFFKRRGSRVHQVSTAHITLFCVWVVWWDCTTQPTPRHPHLFSCSVLSRFRFLAVDSFILPSGAQVATVHFHRGMHV